MHNSNRHLYCDLLSLLLALSLSLLARECYVHTPLPASAPSTPVLSQTASLNRIPDNEQTKNLSTKLIGLRLRLVARGQQRSDHRSSAEESLQQFKR